MKHRELEHRGRFLVFSDKTYTWSYDLGGNITEKRTYAYTTGSLLNSISTADSYTYAASGWKDQLTSFNGQSIIYDAIGNPTTYKGNNLAWTQNTEGRFCVLNNSRERLVQDRDG